MNLLPIEKACELIFYCAVHDQAFIARYDCKGWRQKYDLVAIERIEPGQDAVGGGAQSTILQLDEWDISHSGFRCPWCDSDGLSVGSIFTYCSDCDSYVCSGRSDGERYMCRASCGGVFPPIEHGAPELLSGSRRAAAATRDWRFLQSADKESGSAHVTRHKPDQT